MAKQLWSTIIRTQGTRNSTLLEAIRSVESQTYRPVSVIVSIQPKGSIDPQSVEEFLRDQKLSIPVTTVLANPLKKRGNPINVGLDNCTAQYVSTLDDDDIFYPDMGSILIPILRSRKYNFAYGNTLISRRTLLEEGFNQIGEKVKGFGEPFNPIRLAAQNYLHPSSIIYNFKVFGDIRTHEEHVLWEDWYLYLKMLFSDKLRGIYVDHDVSEYRIVGTNETNSFHTFTKKELQKNYEFIINELADKRFTISQADVFRVYPLMTIIADTPNNSDIQKLLSKIHYSDEILNRKIIRLYLKLCSVFGKLPHAQ